jgi:hypothetical protein
LEAEQRGEEKRQRWRQMRDAEAEVEEIDVGGGGVVGERWRREDACSCHTMRMYHGDSMPSSSMFVSPRGSWPLGETFETRPTWILGRRESATIATPSGKVFLICILDLQ